MARKLKKQSAYNKNSSPKIVPSAAPSTATFHAPKSASPTPASFAYVSKDLRHIGIIFTLLLLSYIVLYVGNLSGKWF
jgi:hypothetical protein